MRHYQSKQVAIGVIAALFTLCMSAAQDSRAQAGAGKRARATAGPRENRTQPKEPDERARTLVEEGRRRADEGKWDEALQAYRQALAINPRYGDAYIYLGDAYMNSGKYKEGFAAYEQAISVAPWNPDAHYSLGAAYNDMGQHGEAFKPFVQAIRLDPGFAEAHYGIGYAYLRLENFRDALVYLRQAARLKPEYAEAHLALGQTQLGLRNSKAAEAELKILADLDPAMARVLEKDIREAVAVAQQAAPPAAPVRGEQTAKRPRPSTPHAAPTASDEGAPRQSTQPPGIRPKSTQDVAEEPQSPNSRPAAAQAENATFELSFWESVKNSADAEEFAAYIRKYPNGQFVELARIRMRALEAKRGVAKVAGVTTGTEAAAAANEDGTKQQAATATAQPSPEQTRTPSMQQTPASASQQLSPASGAATPSPAEPPAKPSTEPPSRLTAEQPSKSSIEQPAQVTAVQPSKEATAKEKEQPVTEPPAKEQPPGEKRAVAAEADAAEAVTTVEDAARLLRRLFPSSFTYQVKNVGEPNAAPAASEVSINYVPLNFDGCQISWRDSNDTLSVSLSDLDAGAVTVSRRVRPSTTFSTEVWDVTIATEGGRGAISEEKGDGSGVANVYNGLDLQYDSRQKAEGVAKILRRAIRLCTGKL